MALKNLLEISSVALNNFPLFLDFISNFNIPKSWKSVKNRGKIHWKSVNLCGFSCLFRAKTVNLQTNT